MPSDVPGTVQAATVPAEGGPALPPRISWGAVLAGSLFAAAIAATLNILGAAIGATTADAVARATPGAARVGIGAATWLVAADALALAAGGYAAARLSGTVGGAGVVLHGLAVWAVALLASAVLIGNLLAGLASTASSAVGSAAGGATSAASGVASQVLPDASPSVLIDRARDTLRGTGRDPQAMSTGQRSAEITSPLGRRVARGGFVGEERARLAPVRARLAPTPPIPHARTTEARTTGPGAPNPARPRPVARASCRCPAGRDAWAAPMLDWDDLRFFLAIVRTGSLSAAARELRVAQSTVGRRLASLEGGLGTRLLHRTPEGYVPTLAGEAILDQVERVEAEALAVERTVGGRDALLEGVVRVTAVETLASHVLAPAFCALQLGSPEIGIELLANVRHMSLAMREADVAVRLTRFEQHDLIARRIGTMAHGLYASPAYLERHGLPDFAAGCPGHRLVAGLDGAEVPQVAGWLAEAAPRAVVALRTDSPEAQLQAALCGEGMACLPRLRGDALGGGLRRLRPPSARAVAEIWLAVHRDNRRTPRIRLVLDAVAAAVRDRAGELDPPEGPGPAETAA